MAADRPLTERGIVEIKMGRSKFPGKPSKIGNRKRVNLSSCALPEDNDSSKAAKNIYLGLSVFNETFGDNEMVAPGPFHGFSMGEVEEAMAEARLQQNEAEIEHKKQGISVNLWDSFQTELFSIISCSSYSTTLSGKNHEINKTKLSFDGGGNSIKSGLTATNDDRPFKSSIIKSHKTKSTPDKKSKIVSFHSPRLKLCSAKSLQSQAAKRLLNKAKMSNHLESNKTNLSEKKFILPSHSIRSSRVIKPNKRFLEENGCKRRLLRSKSMNSASEHHKKLNSLESKATEELKVDVGTDDIRKKGNSSGDSSPQLPSTGKVILREARLQLDNSSLSLLEGPFSSPSASTLSPNSQLRVNPIQSVTGPGNIVCGVCGVVRFYRFVDLAKKFGIYCCESCRKFISKMIKSNESKLQCAKGNGMCAMMPIVKSQHFSLGKEVKNLRCHACWLKLCLKNFKMPTKLKQRLVKLLPVNMQLGINLELSPILSNEISNKFMLSSSNNNIKDFKWLKENSSNPKDTKSNPDKPINWPNSLDSHATNEKFLRKRNRIVGLDSKVKLSSKADVDEKSRQAVLLKGPRVKHVCRSASVALGQPLATFPSEPSPTKRSVSEPESDNCKNCDREESANGGNESQEAADKSSDVAKAEKKAKQGSSSAKASNGAQQQQQQVAVGTKSKKKSNAKAENPISMDFWESYDPDEVCETGFGLIGSETFSVRALCFLCGSSGQERLIHCASCCEPYHEFCVDDGQLKLQNGSWKYDWVCPRCTVCVTCGRTSGQQLRCIKCDNSYHMECVDRVGGRLLHSPDRPWVCSICLRCKSCNGVDVSVFVGNLPLCKACFILRQKGNYCPLCQRCYEDDDYDSKMMECGQCKCWVHAKCEGLSDEKYQVLSFLPESVEYVCRMCCVMPPAPWWIAVEAELKSGYLGVLKALSKNRKACTMLKWSPKKQCTCRQVSFVSRSLDFEETKTGKSDCGKEETSNGGDNKEKYRAASIAERKTSIEVISHPTESLKLTLKIMKETEESTDETNHGKLSTVRVKKCPSNEETSEDSLTNTFDCPEDSQTSLQSLFKGNDFGVSGSELPEKRSLSSPLNPPSDSGIGSTDDEFKTNCLTDEESCREENRAIEVVKPNCDTSVSFLEEKRECFCFLEVDSYNSRSKPFSPNLLSIKKKVTTSEYSSLHQFHQDMQGMIATTQSSELMELYHQTIKEIFPWFDPKFSRVQSSCQKVSGTQSVESTPVKCTPTKNTLSEECKIPKEKLSGQCLDYFYNDYIVDDNRVCLMCKMIGDGPPGDTGRLLYCGQNEWVHCNCALWSGEVFEEIDGSLQNVHSAISRGRSIRCPECSLKGASIGCCARNCAETYHFRCARQVGCIFMDDKTVYCPAHAKESLGKLVQNEKEFEIRRPVYVELDKRKMKIVDSSQVRFAVGALHVNNLGRFVVKLSDQPEAIIPEQFDCTRLFWSCFEPWRIVRYHFTVRLLEIEDDEGIDCGINLTIDHSKEPEVVELKLKQLKHFQDHNVFLDVNEKMIEESLKESKKLVEETCKAKSEEDLKVVPGKRLKKDHKVVKKIFDQDDENCLSDNQNTADLLPPDIEEAIFKDLPHDILDGISMQDIFMDIKNDSYESVTKDEAEGEEGMGDSTPVKAKSDSQTELWSEMSDDGFSKPMRELKRSRSEVLSSQQVKKSANLKTYQKSCGLNWNCKNEGPNKWKKNSKCHVTVNLLEPQERGNMLQELKFTDGLVSVTTGTIDSVRELKARLEDSKRSIQQEEGKENKCLPWHTRLQPRLLQVDGGVDSSSSGSEAGESPQRLADEGMGSKIVSLPQSSPYLDSPTFSINCPVYPTSSSYTPTITYDHPSSSLPQVDGVGDFSDSSDSEDSFPVLRRYSKRPRQEMSLKDDFLKSIHYKISQCDGGIDSESDDGHDPSKNPVSEEKPSSLAPTTDEPVKCKQCHCTYRTKVSYQRHLEACCSDFMLSSSEGEVSEDESSPKKQLSPTKSESPSKIEEIGSIKKEVLSSPVKQVVSEVVHPPENSPECGEKLEVRKEKTAKRTYTKKKPLLSPKKLPVVNNFPQVQQILVQQPNATPTLIVQDIPAPNLVPTTFIDSGPTLGYVTAVDSQNPFGKSQLIATPNGIIQIPSAPEPQIIGSLCLNPQTNVPGFIIQQPPPQGTLISPQPGPVVMSGDQMMLGPTGLFDVIQDPGTGGMFLASHNQPVFYNMETIVSNTVMQTNQFVSNVLATSYSQTSTQIFQTRELEQMVNLPSNYIVVGPNPPATEKILSSDELICVQTPQTLISAGQTPIQIPSQPLFNPPLQTPQAITSEPKIISTQLNPLRCVQVKQVCPIVMNKVTNANTHVINQPGTQVFRQPEVNPRPCYQTANQLKLKPTSKNKILGQSQFRSVPMMRPNVTKSPTRGLERAVATPKVKPQVQPRSRALVDYINNFRSDSCDIFPLKETLPPPPAPPPPPPSLPLPPAPLPQSTVVQNNIDPPSNPQIVPVVSSTFTSVASNNTNVPSCSPPSSTTPHLSPLINCYNVTQKPKSPTPPPPPTPPAVTKFASPSSPASTSRLSSVVSPQKYPEPQLEKSPKTSSSKNPEKDSIEPFYLNTPLKVLTNMTNSVIFDREPKLNLSMPSLDDSPIPEEKEQPKSTPQSSPKTEGDASEVLPLQESIISSSKANSISPQKVSPTKNSPPAEEKLKTKRKPAPVDQNILDAAFLPGKSLPKEETIFSNRTKNGKVKRSEEKGPKLIFDVISDDGFKSSSTSMVELWANICDSVQEMRSVLKIPPLPVSRKGHEILGMQNHGLQHCLEQLRGVEQCIKYKFKYFLKEETRKDEDDESSQVKENLSGCARTEQFDTRKEYDMFAWLASKHRRLPKLSESAEETLSSIRRANSLPMAMRYRNLKETAKLYLGVYRSKIHGKGLFCLREIEAGEMVIEYAGEVIRSTLTDKREKVYTDKGIGCYMFRIDDHFVIDATMKGNAARFINHSCEPNCYSRVVDILGKKHIVIFALRRINVMEELTYDYKFPFEDEKISCHCLSKKCRKYLN